MLKKILILVFFICCNAAWAAYDGLWFLGFNLERDIFKNEQNKELRFYLAQHIDRELICREVFSDEKIADSFVYPIANYNPKNELRNLLAKKVNYTKVRPLILLHSDGLKTCQAANMIVRQLASANIEVVLKKVDLSKHNSWEEALLKKDYDLFLMGFKAEYMQDIDSFLIPLYTSSGYANFMNYSNPVIDKQMANFTNTSSMGRQTVLNLINKNISDDLPLLPFFYIERIN